MQTPKELQTIAILQTMGSICLLDDIRRCETPYIYHSNLPCTCLACKGNLVVISSVLRQWLTDNGMPS